MDSSQASFCQACRAESVRDRFNLISMQRACGVFVRFREAAAAYHELAFDTLIFFSFDIFVECKPFARIWTERG